MKPIFIYDKLKGRIREKFKTDGAFADAMGITLTTLGKKFKNEYYFSQKEILKAVILLDIPFSQIHTYFFTVKV